MAEVYLTDLEFALLSVFKSRKILDDEDVIRDLLVLAEKLKLQRE